MAHDHHHDHDSHSGYYLEQLSTIAACGALGIICVLMYTGDLLFILAPQFRLWVLLGGIALLVFTAARAVSLWITVGQAPLAAKAHEDDHSHAHEYEHHHHDHAPGEKCDHDHGHEHGHDHGHHHHHHDQD